MPELKRTPIHGDARDFVFMPDLEAMLENGKVLHGCKRNKQGKENWAWDDNYTDDTTTHTCLAIGVQPIENQEPVSKSEIIKILQKCEYNDPSGEIDTLIAQIKVKGLKND